MLLIPILSRLNIDFLVLMFVRSVLSPVAFDECVLQYEWSHHSTLRHSFFSNCASAWLRFSTCPCLISFRYSHGIVQTTASGGTAKKLTRFDLPFRPLCVSTVVLIERCVFFYYPCICFNYSSFTSICKATHIKTASLLHRPSRKPCAVIGAYQRNEWSEEKCSRKWRRRQNHSQEMYAFEDISGMTLLVCLFVVGVSF